MYRLGGKAVLGLENEACSGQSLGWGCSWVNSQCQARRACAILGPKTEVGRGEGCK